MLRRTLRLKFFLLAALPVILGIALSSPPSVAQSPPCPWGDDVALSLPVSSDRDALLKESWQVYRQRFIEADGRVVDREDNDRSISEGQAYAMLRAVLVNDPDTFWRTFTWGESNLARVDARGQKVDELWAWKWGQRGDSWGILDNNFAIDADIDAATALILAARRWNCPAYLELAKTKLVDIWRLSTVALPNGERQLLPGPVEAFWPEPNLMILNPSYFAPYSFRLFAQVDPQRDWASLIDSGYAMLEDSAVTERSLPADWIGYDPEGDVYRLMPFIHPLESRYSFDAYRVWWRLAWDAAWFDDERAQRYLRQHLQPLVEQWQQAGRIPARLTLGGLPLSSYEATSQYAMLFLALQQIEPAVAREIYAQKLQTTYSDGIWDNDRAYYTQNLAWLGLMPLDVPQPWLGAELRHQF